MALKKLLLFVAITVLAVPSPMKGQTLAPVIMPGADMMIQVKLDKIRKSPIYIAMKALEKKQKDMAAGKPLSGFDESEKFFAAIRETTGLESSDFLSLVATANLDGINLEQEPDFADLKAVVGVRLGKEVSIDQVEKALKAFAAMQAEKEGTPPPTFSRLSHGGHSLLKIDGGEDEMSAVVALAGNNKILLAGDQEVVKATLDRYQSGNNVSPKSLFPAAIGRTVGMTDFYVIFKPTADMTAQMKTQSENAPGHPAGMLMAQMKAAGLGIRFADSMDLGVYSNFATPEAAQQASTLTDAQAISGIKMFASMMSGGAPLPVLQTMKTGADQTGTAWFKMSLSQADLDTIGQTMEKQMRQMQQMQEGMDGMEEMDAAE